MFIYIRVNLNELINIPIERRRPINTNIWFDISVFFLYSSVTYLL